MKKIISLVLILLVFPIVLGEQAPRENVMSNKPVLVKAPIELSQEEPPQTPHQPQGGRRRHGEDEEETSEEITNRSLTYNGLTIHPITCPQYRGISIYCVPVSVLNQNREGLLDGTISLYNLRQEYGG